MNKFTANVNMSFYFKHKFDASVVSALMYSGETWQTNNFKYNTSQYSKLVKCLLAVRSHIAMNVCLTESSIYPVHFVINENKMELF